MGLKATNNLLGIEDMRQELISYCKATSCGGCLFKLLCCDFNSMDEEEIEIYYALIFETDEMEREDKKELIYEIQWLKQHYYNGCKNCALVDVRDCSCFDKEEIIHRNFDAIMKKRKEILEYCKKHSCVSCAANDICNRNINLGEPDVADSYIERVCKKALKDVQNHGEDEKPDTKVRIEGKANLENTPSVILENSAENETVIKISSSRKIDSVTIVFAEEKGEKHDGVQK